MTNSGFYTLWVGGKDIKRQTSPEFLLSKLLPQLPASYQLKFGKIKKPTGRP